MSKLSINDVAIIGEGPQIRNVIKQKCDSIRNFYNANKSNISIEYNTFRSYFNRDYINAATFKCIITKILDVDYNSLFVPIPKQIDTHVQNIYEEIMKYNQEDDQQMIDYLIEQCNKHKMTTELAMMYRAKARNFYYTNWINRCTECYDYAIRTLPMDEINKKVFFHCELAYDLTKENMLDKADKKFKLIEDMIRIHKEKLDSNTLFYYHYWRGIAYMNINKNAHARELFRIAKEYAPRKFEKAGAISNIGLTFKKSGQYEEALKYYLDALNYPDESRVLTTATIRNNTATVYKAIKDYTSALEYIQKALDIAEKENDLSCKLGCTETYVEIQMEIGNSNTYKIYLAVLLSTKGKKTRKVDTISSIISFIDSTDNKSCLIELADIIIELKNASNNDDYNNGLHECMWNIMKKIRKFDKEGIL